MVTRTAVALCVMLGLALIGVAAAPPPEATLELRLDIRPMPGSRPTRRHLCR